jgi:hypothetical protein
MKGRWNSNDGKHRKGSIRVIKNETAQTNCHTWHGPNEYFKIQFFVCGGDLPQKRGGGFLSPECILWKHMQERESIVHEAHVNTRMTQCAGEV